MLDIQTLEEESMAQIYRLTENGGGEKLKRINCVNEEKELQFALEKNFDLLPGDQISPDDPCQWLLIRREMPVPDPTSGLNRWNIDFLFADQNGMPTFVECKRFNDTDSRRKVVGQMLEYAANGHYYWTTAELAAFAEQSSRARGNTTEEELKRISWPNSDEPETYFQTIEENLREGQVRLVFFLEEAPPELKSIVEFLNGQMVRSDVLLVEARQYEIGSHKIISPVLFGYSEEARFIKRKVSVESGSKQKWNVDSFFEQCSETLDPTKAQVIRQLLDNCENLGCETSWGSGKQGTYSVKWPEICSKNLFNVKSDGRMEVNLGAMNTCDQDEVTRDHLKTILAESMSLPMPDDYQRRYPGYKLEEWSAKARVLVDELEKLLRQS
jgi:hypothetical protein